MKTFEKFQDATKDITGVYCIIACLGCLSFSMGINPIAIAVLCGTMTGVYKVAMGQYICADSDQWLLVMKDG